MQEKIKPSMVPKIDIKALWGLDFFSGTKGSSIGFNT